MKRLFLASSMGRVAGAIAQEIGSAGDMSLAFILTASEPKAGEKAWLTGDRQGLVDAGFRVDDYTITGKTQQQIAKDLASYDVIHLDGGNTFYLLEQIQQTGAAQVIGNLINQGKMYSGSSAGSIVAGPTIEPVYSADDRSKAPNLKDCRGLDLVDFVVLPHWGRPDHTSKYLNDRIDRNYTETNKLILLTDNQYISVKDDYYKIVDVTEAHARSAT